MRVVDDFGGDDERSMLADNTSAFNCRLVPGTSVWAQHAYGRAVDINPFENAEIQGGQVDPSAAAPWADRSRVSPAMITRRRCRLAGLPLHRLDVGRGLALAEGLHALLRQRTVNQLARPARGDRSRPPGMAAAYDTAGAIAGDHEV